MIDGPTGVKTNGKGKRTTAHLNLTRSMADKPRKERGPNTYRPLPGRAPYAGFDETEFSWWNKAR